LGVVAALVRHSGNIQLQLTLSNVTQATINGFAIQVNKNPFGLGPGAQLVVPDLVPGSTVDTTLAMMPGILANGGAPTNPLYLQVAVKNSLDVFYFNVPFELPAVLIEDSGISRDDFTTVWQRVGEGRQQVVQGSSAGSFNVDTVKSKLSTDNIHYVAQRQVDADNVHVYIAATTVNKCVILGEVAVAGGCSNFKMNVRTETPVLVPLFVAAVSKRLGVTVR
jgi:AP-1 complex subunit beta-1